jgi:hypothetical protein
VLRREQLIEILYDDEEEDAADDNLSVRFEISLWRASHQVLSRLRKALAYCFADEMPKGTEWLQYSEPLDGWILYRLPGFGSDGGWH